MQIGWRMNTVQINLKIKNELSEYFLVQYLFKSKYNRISTKTDFVDAKLEFILFFIFKSKF